MSWFVTWHCKIRTLAYPHLKILDSSYKTEWKKGTISKNVFKLTKAENVQQQADPLLPIKMEKLLFPPWIMTLFSMLSLRAEIKH